MGMINQAGQSRGNRHDPPSYTICEEKAANVIKRKKTKLRRQQAVKTTPHIN
jgi:hypothetical protein